MKRIKATVMVLVMLVMPLAVAVGSVNGADGTPAGPAGAASNGLDPDLLYALEPHGGLSKRLIGIDPQTGSVQTVVWLSTSTYGVAALAFSPDGDLYTIAWPRELIRIDVQTGRVTRIGLMWGYSNPMTYAGMAFDREGNLYAMDVVLHNLLKIDTNTAKITLVGPTGLSGNLHTGMAVDFQTNELYALMGRYDGITDRIVRLDKNTGAATHVRNIGVDINGVGVEFHPGTGKLYGVRDNTRFVEIDLAAGMQTDIATLSGVKTNNLAALWPEQAQPPVADAGPDRTIDEGGTVQFDGTGSSDPDGAIVSYQWDFGEGSTGTGPSPAHTYGDNGVFTVTLTVTDDDGLTDTDTTTVTVMNVDPTIESLTAAMDADIGLRVAGSKWSNVRLTVFEGGDVFGILEVERWPGSPDSNPTTGGIPGTLDLTNSYTAVVTYDPYPDDMPNNGKDGKNNAANPVWLTIGCNGGEDVVMKHTFNTQQSMLRDSDHWNHVDAWEVDINSELLGCLFDVTTRVTDPGSDDIFLDYEYGTQTASASYLRNPPNTDPYPSPDVDPVDTTDVQMFAYEGAALLSVTANDDDGGSSVLANHNTEIH